MRKNVGLPNTIYRPILIAIYVGLWVNWSDAISWWYVNLYGKPESADYSVTLNANRLADFG